MNRPGDAEQESVEVAAAVWLARRDRGLSAAEAREFERWVADPACAQALRELEGPFGALDRAAQLRPGDGATPDPDLLQPAREPARVASGARRGRWVRLGVGGLAAAAALALGIFLHSTGPAVPDALAPRRVVRLEPQRLTLPDGSRVELKPGSAVEPAFTPEVRRVRLRRGGEAYFAVAKDPARPFIVVVDDVAVRAVGTEFVVSAAADAVQVVVTEGRVRVDDAAGRSLLATAAADAKATAGAVSAGAAEAEVSAGQRVIIPAGRNDGVAVPVLAVTEDEVARATAWRALWLEFAEMPLADVIREFNLHARPESPLLRVADSGTGAVLVSGAFRADGVEAFVRLLDSSFGIEARQSPDGRLLLRKRE